MYGENISQVYSKKQTPTTKNTFFFFFRKDKKSINEPFSHFLARFIPLASNIWVPQVLWLDTCPTAAPAPFWGSGCGSQSGRAGKGPQPLGRAGPAAVCQIERKRALVGWEGREKPLVGWEGREGSLVSAGGCGRSWPLARAGKALHWPGKDVVWLVYTAMFCLSWPAGPSIWPQRMSFRSSGQNRLS